MLKVLIKKQFMECFRTYFVDPKTGRARTKKAVAGWFVFFAALMVFLCAAFLGLAFLMGSALIEAGMTWMYYSIMGIIAILLGTFGSVFSTYASLYLAKDNELLLSMPVPPSRILAARVSVVFGMSLLYSGVVWIPALIYGWTAGAPSAAAVVFGGILLIMIALFTTVLTSLLGWVVALVSKKTRRKSFITVILSMVFFALYYIVCFRMMDIMTALVDNRESVSKGLKTWGNLIYQLGNAADGKASGMLIFCGVTALLFAVCCCVLSKSFIRIVTASTAEKKKEVRASDIKAADVRTALFKRELKRFTGSSTYMLNCGLGVAILIAIAVLALVNRNDLSEALNLVTELAYGGPDISGFLVTAVLLVVCVCTGFNPITVPSVSLEGKTMWLIKSLPVSAGDVLAAKEQLHIRICLPPAILAQVVLDICLGVGTVETLLSTVFIAVFVLFMADFGLKRGIKKPVMNWTTEAIPIKQNLSILLVMLLSLLIPLAVSIVCGGAGLFMDVKIALAVCTAVMGIAAVRMHRWVGTKGAKLFEQL